MAQQHHGPVIQNSNIGSSFGEWGKLKPELPFVDRVLEPSMPSHDIGHMLVVKKAHGGSKYGECHNTLYLLGLGGNVPR